LACEHAPAMQMKHPDPMRRVTHYPPPPRYSRIRPIYGYV
jgi:hypothetical protein